MWLMRHVSLDSYSDLLQLRRQTRLRREYIYKKSIEQRELAIQEKKQKLKRAIDGKTKDMLSVWIVCLQ